MGYVVISYDISDDRTRSKVANLLADYGRRVQYSVFECRLDAKRLEKLVEKLKPFAEGNDITPWERLKRWRLSRRERNIGGIIAKLRGTMRTLKRKKSIFLHFRLLRVAVIMSKNVRLSPNVIFRNLYIYLKIISSNEMENRSGKLPLLSRRRGLGSVGV